MRQQKKTLNKKDPNGKPLVSRYGIKQHQKAHPDPVHDCKICQAISDLNKGGV